MLILLLLKTKLVIGLAILAVGIGLGRVKNAQKLAAAKALETKLVSDVTTPLKNAETVVINEVKKV